MKAAAELFMSKGYDAVSLREIAKLANVHPTIPGYHFESKQNLWLETVKHLFREVEDMMDDTAAFNPDLESPVEYLRRHTRIRVAHSAYNPALIRIIHTEMLYRSERLLLIKDILDKMRASPINLLGQLRSYGIASHLNMDAFSFVALNLVTAPFLSYFQVNKKPTKKELEKLIDNHTELLVQFLVGKPSEDT